MTAPTLALRALPSRNLADRATAWFGVGSWRLLLAGFVAASHLWARMIQGPAAYAVWGFYVLSGYLMTYVLLEKYGVTRRGLKNYAFNRFIRIYPGYWIALILGVIVFQVLMRNNIDPRQLNPEFFIPSGWGWLNPLTLFPLFQPAGLPVAVSNALAIEIGAYILMPLLARSRAAAWVMAIVAGLVALDLGFTTETFATRYATFVPCLLPFAAGSLICHYRHRLARIAAPRLSLVVWLLHGIAWWWFSGWPWSYGLYVSVVLSAWVTISLTRKKSSRADTLFGDLSYPVYLLHTLVGACFLGIWGPARPLRFAVLGIAATIVVSYLMMTLVERPLYRLKRRGTRAPEKPDPEIAEGTAIVDVATTPSALETSAAPAAAGVVSS